MKLSLAKISKQPKWCLVYFLNCSSNNFWCNSFNFCPTRSDGLINSLLSNFIDLSRCLVDNVWGNFTNLIYYVSASICNIIAIEKSTGLLLARQHFPFASTFSTASASFWENSYLDVVVSDATAAVSLSLHITLLNFLVQ